MNEATTIQPTAVNPNKALWEKGDFTQLAATMRTSGSALIDKLMITAGMKILDVGCGDGTTAIPAARLGADVQGVDIARNLVEAGNKRIKEEGLTNITIREGDATNLHDIEDETFDLVISIFGCLFFIIQQHYFEYQYAYQHSSMELPLRYMVSCFWEDRKSVV